MIVADRRPGGPSPAPVVAAPAPPPAPNTTTVTKADGGRITTELGYGIALVKGSSLHREWIAVHDTAIPVDTDGTPGVDTIYGAFERTWVRMARFHAEGFQMRTLPTHVPRAPSRERPNAQRYADSRAFPNADRHANGRMLPRLQ